MPCFRGINTTQRPYFLCPTLTARSMIQNKLKITLQSGLESIHFVVKIFTSEDNPRLEPKFSLLPNDSVRVSSVVGDDEA